MVNLRYGTAGHQSQIIQYYSLLSILARVLTNDNDFYDYDYYCYLLSSAFRFEIIFYCNLYKCAGVRYGLTTGILLFIETRKRKY